MLLTLQTICTNRERRLAVRASNERPYRIVRTVAILRSGIIFFDITNYLHELGTAAHRKTKPPSAVHALSRAVRFYKGFPEVILLKSVVFRGFAVIDFFVEAMFFCTNYNIGSGITNNIKCDNSHTGEVVHSKNERVANHTKI